MGGGGGHDAKPNAADAAPAARSGDGATYPVARPAPARPHVVGQVGVGAGVAKLGGLRQPGQRVNGVAGGRPCVFVGRGGERETGSGRRWGARPRGS